MKADKFQATREAIIFFIRSMGPAEYSEIMQEVKEQAFLSHFPKALASLMQDQTIKYDTEFKCYELRQG